MRTVGQDTLVASATTSLSVWNPQGLSPAPWVPLPPTGANDLQVAATGVGLQAPTTASQGYPVFLWSNGTFDPSGDQWVQCTLSAAVGSLGLAVVLRASGTQLLLLQFTPTSNFCQIHYTTAYSNTWTPSSATYAVPGGSNLTISPALAVGDVFRIQVQGINVQVWRSTGGGPMTQVAAGGSALTPAAQWTGGRAGVSAVRGALWGIRDWSAGDFVPSVLPPAPPTGPQGAFTVRTT